MPRRKTNTPPQRPGPKAKPIIQRALHQGKARLSISAAHAVKLARLMLVHPEVLTPEALLEALIDRDYAAHFGAAE